MMPQGSSATHVVAAHGAGGCRAQRARLPSCTYFRACYPNGDSSTSLGMTDRDPPFPHCFGHPELVEGSRRRRLFDSGHTPFSFFFLRKTLPHSIPGWRHALGALALLVAVAVAEPPDDPDTIFAQAALAYDAGDYGVAVELYSQLLAAGWRAPALYYNLGNAQYRVGDIGAAVLAYRRAQHLAPRDRTARRNLDFVLAETAALEPGLAWWTRRLQLLSLGEWVGVATVAWWLLAFHLAGHWWSAGQRRTWRGLACFWMLVVLLAMAGLYQRLDLQWRPAYVITASGLEALFAPLDNATAHFSLPKGSTVRIMGGATGWYRVRLDQREGWVRQNVGERVLPSPQ